MLSILSIKNLSYKLEGKTIFQDFSLEVKEKSFTSIIGPNGCGKTLLTKIICAIFPTVNVCMVDNISLNKKTVLKYITKIGVVTNEFKTPFLFNKVNDELVYSLSNLGYSENKIEKNIAKIIKKFDMEEILDKNISDLTDSTKSKLLIVLSLLHNPKILILDDAFANMTKNDKKMVLKRLLELQKRGLTILNITSNLDTIYPSDTVYVLKDFKLDKPKTVEELFNDTSYLRKIGLSIPFVVDFSLKLKQCGLIEKIFFDLEKLEEELWK